MVFNAIERAIIVSLALLSSLLSSRPIGVAIEGRSFNLEIRNILELGCWAYTDTYRVIFLA